MEHSLLPRGMIALRIHFARNARNSVRSFCRCSNFSFNGSLVLECHSTEVILGFPDDEMKFLPHPFDLLVHRRDNAFACD